jgi:hypothetical protein
MNRAEKERIINQLNYLISRGGNSKSGNHEEDSIEYFHFFNELKTFLVKEIGKDDEIIKKYINQLPRLKQKNFESFELNSAFFFKTIISAIFFPYFIYWIGSEIYQGRKKHKDIDKINIILNKIIFILKE